MEQSLKVKCPSCGEWVAWNHAAFRPFCSEKCQRKDLGHWANEDYRVESDEELAGNDADENKEE